MLWPIESLETFSLINHINTVVVIIVLLLYAIYKLFLDQDVFLLFTLKSPSLLEQIPHKICFKTSIPCICWRDIVVLLLGDYSLLAINLIKVYSCCKHYSIKLSRQNIQIYLSVVKSGGYGRRDGVPGTANGYVSHMRKSVFLVTDT